MFAKNASYFFAVNGTNELMAKVLNNLNNAGHHFPQKESTRLENTVF